MVRMIFCPALFTIAATKLLILISIKQKRNPWTDGNNFVHVHHCSNQTTYFDIHQAETESMDRWQQQKLTCSCPVIQQRNGKNDILSCLVHHCSNQTTYFDIHQAEKESTDRWQQFCPCSPLQQPNNLF